MVFENRVLRRIFGPTRDDYYYSFRCGKLIFSSRDDIRKEIHDLKRELQNDKKKKKEEEQEDGAAQRNEVAKNETVEAYKQEQEKYKQLKNQVPKKGNDVLFMFCYVNIVRTKI
jgi:hypothetical protein